MLLNYSVIALMEITLGNKSILFCSFAIAFIGIFTFQDASAFVDADISSAEVISPYRLSIGDQLTIDYVLKNVGDERHEFFIGFSVVHENGKWTDISGETITLRPGASDTIRLMWNIDENTVEGVYEARFAVWEERKEGIEPNQLNFVSIPNAVQVSSIDKASAALEPSQQGGENGGGCLIATATYGTELAPQVQQLRELRDNHLLETESGSTFMTGFNQLYYSFSPTIADLERESPLFKELVKLTITPLITSLSILNYVDMDSDTNVLGYGIILILLNVGMYIVAPVGIGIVIARKF